MSDSVRPHRRQPTRLPRPWDSPGKNIGVGCHFLLQCMKVKSESEVASRIRLFATPWTAAYQAPWSRDFPSQSTGVRCLAFCEDGQRNVKWSNFWRKNGDILKASLYVNSTTSQVALVVKNPCQCRRHKRHGFNLWVGRYPGGVHGNLLQYSCFENPMDRGVWQSIVHRVTRSWTQLK